MIGSRNADGTNSNQVASYRVSWNLREPAVGNFLEKVDCRPMQTVRGNPGVACSNNSIFVCGGRVQNAPSTTCEAFDSQNGG